MLSAWQAADQPYDVALAHLSLADALSATGSPDARSHLAAASEAAAAIGAGWLSERIAARRGDELGPTPGVHVTAGMPPLTARENEVLDLIAKGSTNNDIAAALFISPKTASVHVSRILTKLGVRNRTEAANVALSHLPHYPSPPPGS